ncbi:hypothetical protein NLI96_g1544 [Meripilus lineatus]|uniref:Uncharacterized protein n=1 Tax=Meripilus lineatus TaxID=2056292 RepID=A0AAD5VA87_9APHY|nr:hypothetical protein NLI96_g1544 [Physisporinus lineatus]
MPLFPSLGRSRHRAPSSSSQYDDRYAMQYENEEPTRTPQWRHGTPRKQRPQGTWEEELVDYPSRAPSYAAPGPGQHQQQQQQQQQQYYSLGPRFSAQVYSASTVTDETHDELYSDTGSDSTVPVVQRVDSTNPAPAEMHDRHMSRVTEIPIPSQMYSEADFANEPELRNMYPQQQPVLVNQSVVGSMHPDIVQGEHHRERARVRHEAHRREYARSASSDESERRQRWDPRGEPMEAYPPCVVVIEKGRHGKQDTYYVIPGGAPVIFEDQHGREITRVGDFSGQYRPEPPRPVIIEDNHGRELYRMGFDDNGHHSSRRHDRDETQRRGRQYSDHYRDQRDHEADYYRRGDDYRSPRTREPDRPNIVFVDPSNSSQTGKLTRRAPHGVHIAQHTANLLEQHNLPLFTWTSSPGTGQGEFLSSRLHTTQYLRFHALHSTGSSRASPRSHRR